jgi:hypothetical protein
MSSRLVPLVLAAGLLGLAPLPAEEVRAYTPAVREGGELRYVQGIPVLIVQGSPEEMGRQQAALIGSTIKRLMGLPRLMIEYGREGGWAAASEAAQTVMGHAAERHRRELASLAEALGAKDAGKSGLAVGNVLAELRRFERCSALLIEPPRSATGEILFGRNYDYPTYGLLDNLSLVTIYRPKGYHALASVGYPGSIGVLSGMNDAGLAVACLDSGPAKDDSPRFDARGAPMLLTFRRLLEECTTLAEAEKLLCATRHTTWFNLAACDRKQAAVFEITAKQVVTRRPEDHLVAATNHFRSPELITNKRGNDRYEKLVKHGKQKEPLTWSDVARALHDARMRVTVQSMIFEPGTLTLRLSVSSRPASAGPFVPLDLRVFLGAQPSEPAKSL